MDTDISLYSNTAMNDTYFFHDIITTAFTLYVQSCSRESNKEASLLVTFFTKISTSNWHVSLLYDTASYLNVKQDVPVYSHMNIKYHIYKLV